MSELGGIIDLLKLWTQNTADAERKLAKIIEKGIDRITEKESSLFKRFKKGPDLRIPVKRWMEQVNYELSITGTLSSTTLTFSGNLLGAAITAASMQQHIKPGTILERGDGMQCKVTAVNYSGPSATVAAHGNTSLSNDSGAVVYDIIGDAVSDSNTDFVARSLDRGWRACGTQIWKENLKMPWTKRNTAMEAVADEMQHQMTELITNLQNKIAVACLRIRPNYSGGNWVYGLNVEDPTMCGLMAWIYITQGESANTAIWKDMTSEGAVTPDTLNQLIFDFDIQEKADYNKGDWVVGCHPVTHQFLSDFYTDQRWFQMGDKTAGKYVEVFRSSIGKNFPIVSDHRLRKDVLLVVDCSDVEYGYYAGDHVRVVDIAQGYARQDEKMVTCQTWGTKIRKPRQSICGMYNLPTTYA